MSFVFLLFQALVHTLLQFALLFGQSRLVQENGRMPQRLPLRRQLTLETIQQHPRATQNSPFLRHNTQRLPATPSQRMKARGEIAADKPCTKTAKAAVVRNVWQHGLGQISPDAEPIMSSAGHPHIPHSGYLRPDFTGPVCLDFPSSAVSLRNLYIKMSSPLAHNQ